MNICEGCGTCALVCPRNAITLGNVKIADAFITELDKGIVSRAEMEIGSDGSPGTGCPVISSITGSDAVLIVAEPTESGFHDLTRIASLCQHFGIFAMVCINKCDINESISMKIESFAREQGMKFVGRIPYDDAVRRSINELKPIIHYEESMASKAIESMWKNIKNLMFEEELKS